MSAMRTLTLLQPWATLVASGAKQIETRSSSTKYRGPLAIHSSARWTEEARAFARNRAVIARLGDERVFPLGAIVAVCDLVDCVATDDVGVISPWEEAFGDYSPGRYAWYLHNIVPLDEPVPAKGALGLWTYQAEVFDLEATV